MAVELWGWQSGLWGPGDVLCRSTVGCGAGVSNSGLGFMTTRTLFAGKESAWEGWDPLHQAGHVTLKDHKIDRKRPKRGYVSKHTVKRYHYAPNIPQRVGVLLWRPPCS